MSRTASSAEPVSSVGPAELQGPWLDFLNAYQQVPQECLLPPATRRHRATTGKALPTISFLPQCKPLLKNLLRSESRAGRDSGSLVPFLAASSLPAQGAFQESRTCGRSSVRLSRGSAISIRVVLLQPQVRPRPTSRAQRLLPSPLECLGIFDRQQSPPWASHAALTVCLVR